MSGETYSTLHCGTRVTDRVWTTQQTDTKDVPFKYIIKDKDGKLLAHLIFTNKDQEGITDEDLKAIILDREQIKGRAK